MKQIIENTTLTETSKTALIEYSRDETEHSVMFVTFKDILIPVWNRIQNHKNQTEIKSVLNSEIQDGLCKCFTGRISRLVNCLSGYCDDIEIKIGTNEQIGNVVIMVKEKLERGNEYTIDRHRDQVKKELEERGYDKETIDDWIRFIDE